MVGSYLSFSMSNRRVRFRRRLNWGWIAMNCKLGHSQVVVGISWGFCTVEYTVWLDVPDILSDDVVDFFLYPPIIGCPGPPVDITAPKPGTRAHDETMWAAEGYGNGKTANSSISTTSRSPSKKRLRISTNDLYSQKLELLTYIFVADSVGLDSLVFT